ncbi:NYN domain-containing protein [Helicobacter sp. L8]|uniref:NYN domain-containing protein n=1 Tax=Helicobacter sp. L8 TaxID=2316078 RepID=UPI000EAFB3E5|nr:NYN domain-containing protein [Helicobacter sp. L8]
MKVAVLIDWENLRRDLIYLQNADPNFKEHFDYNKCSNIMTMIHSFLEKDEMLYRIFFYTAKPTNPADLKKKAESNSELSHYLENNQDQTEKMKCRFNKINEFINNISYEKFVALRLGTLQFKGIYYQRKNKQAKLNIVQKQVDMLLGLDISHIAHNKLADRLLIFCKDTDILPSIKYARLNGLHVALAHLTGETQAGIHIAPKLKVHSDDVRIQKTKDIIDLITSTSSSHHI